MLRKELVQAFRDPRMRMMILLVPVLQTLVFGYAVTTDVRRVDTAVVDMAHTTETRDMVRRFTASGIFRPVLEEGSFESAWSAMDQDRVQALLLFDAGGRLQIVIDGSRGISSGIAAGYAMRMLMMEASPRIGLTSTAWYNPRLESRFFYVPGVIAMMVMIITLILSCMAVVREKEMGTMEQILVTPIRRWEFILGKTLPFAAIGIVDVLLVSGVAVAWFHIPLLGSLPLLVLGALLYVMNTLGVGLLISTVSRTQQQAMLSAFFFVFPAVLLSGFAFPIENMPGAVRTLTLLNPVRHMMSILRETFLKGNGLDYLWPEYLALLLLGTALLTAATLRFRKSM
jgi:ABC-2 type transport system permease protein